MAAIITPAELASHSKPDDLWVAVDGTVYDLSDFADVRGVDGARLGLSCCLLLAACALRCGASQRTAARARAQRATAGAKLSLHCREERAGEGGI